MKLFLYSYFILLSFSAFADEPRERYLFKSENELFFLKKTKTSYDSLFIDDGEFKYYEYKNFKEIWTLYKSIDSTALYSFNDTTLYYKTAKISNDGSSIVVVNDYCPDNRSTPILKIYKNGKSIKDLDLFDIIDNYASCSHSASHFDWCFDFHFSDLNPNNFVINTYEFKEVSIDLKSGQVVNSIYLNHIDKDTKVLYGKVEGLGGNLYQIRVWTKINGKVSRFKPYKFSSDHKLNYGTQTIVVNNDNYDVRFSEKCYFLMYNMCDFKPLYKKN
jgi:hypothetical protein